VDSLEIKFPGCFRFGRSKKALSHPAHISVASSKVFSALPTFTETKTDSPARLPAISDLTANCSPPFGHPRIEKTNIFTILTVCFGFFITFARSKNKLKMNLFCIFDEIKWF
jgi:hypothetical protein